MTDRATRLKNTLLSPGVSIALGLIPAAAMLPGNPVAALLSALVCALMVYNIKARALFRGPYFPFAAIFMTLQAAVGATWQATMPALLFAVVLTGAYLLYQRPSDTKTIFVMFLLCGLGALWERCFMLCGVALLAVIILLRAFSLRGFVASLLGFITPLIIFFGFGQLDVFTLYEDYLKPYDLTISPQWMLSPAVAVIFALAMFLPSYGYPAKQRARNMAMLGLTACACALPCIDPESHALLLPLLNLCAAYNVGHLAATRRFGWIGALLVIIVAVAAKLCNAVWKPLLKVTSPSSRASWRLRVTP